MEAYEDSGPEKKSQFNSAIAQLYRLDDLWKDSHKHSRNIDYTKWNEDLDRVWLELSSDATKTKTKGDDEDSDKEKMDTINLKLEKAVLYSLNPLLRAKNPFLFAKIMNHQKNLLMEKEEFLRSLLNKQGKGSAYQDEIEDYMD